MAELFHCTSVTKLRRYCETGAILPPVRAFSMAWRAKEWGTRCGRTVILKIQPQITYPLPDHQPCAYWTPDMIREWEIVNV